MSLSRIQLDAKESLLCDMFKSLKEEGAGHYVALRITGAIPDIKRHKALRLLNNSRLELGWS